MVLTYIDMFCILYIINQLVMEHNYLSDWNTLDEYLSTGLSMPEVSNKVRYPRSVACIILDSLYDILSGVDRYVVCGSYRRGKSIISDIDIVVITDDFDRLSEHRDCLWSGSSKVSFCVMGVQVDFRLATEDTWVTMALYFTGSREENIRLRGIAKYRGWKLNEYGLWDGRDDNANRIRCDSEQDIYGALGLVYVAPSGR